ncbi:hypothetical protein PE066_03555 [Ramlibacter tataouinensis]|uniref:hypothetical protein n=1 Tax=Ramlibacter tataouinensis TaxID=94132 RepID=UPI0022F3AA6B|nr:hypothetical protein [Ramlibacter tataouinensis]WBY02626.1 hypothetical protein PE066_03555 [Ramlibacter tataouinensis]
MEPLAPDDVGARWMAAMRAGDWAAAWRATDALEIPRRRMQSQPGFERRPWHLCWDGTPFEGRTVLVRCEHGLGDTLQFLRFVPLLRQRARELHLMVQPPLVALLTGAPGLGQVHDGWQGPHWPKHEVEIEVMELAYALRTTAATLPPPYPHLAGQAGRRSRLRIGEEPGQGRVRVGLLWAASDWDSSRSLPWPVLAPLLRCPGVRFHALQQGPAAHAAALDPAVVPLWQRTDRIEDAAAAMLQMDLVIAIDGMAAHLAGGQGRPTWLLLKHEADWRWMDGRSDSPWYPSMRLFRQRRAGDWAGLVDEVAAALSAWSTAAAAPCPPG